MIYSAMTQDEVVHYAGLHASTDLERALVRVIRDEMDCLRAEVEDYEGLLKSVCDEADLNAEERDKLQEILEDPGLLAARLAELLCSN